MSDNICIRSGITEISDRHKSLIYHIKFGFESGVTNMAMESVIFS